MSPKEKASTTDLDNRPTFEEDCTPRERFDHEFAILFEVISGIVLSDLFSEAKENGVDTATALQEQYMRAYRVARYFVDLADTAEKNEDGLKAVVPGKQGQGAAT